MSFDDEDEIDAFFCGDDALSMITPDSLEIALSDFCLDLAPPRDWDWLASALRRALAVTVASSNAIQQQLPATDIRKELKCLAALAQATSQELQQRSGAADSRLWHFAFDRWGGEGGVDVGDGKIIGEPSEYYRFKAAVAELGWLASCIGDAAETTSIPRGPWEQAQRRRLRVERGQCLAPVFEAAFGQKPTANNWPSGTEPKPSAFMDFYQRMVALAFEERATPDISGVLKYVCSLHKQHPEEPAENMSPRS